MIALDVEPERGLELQERFRAGLATAATVDGEIAFAERMARIGVDVRAVDLERAPYPLADASADAVVLTEVIEHLWVDPLTALSEVNRVLRPGGVCLMSTPNLLSARNRLAFVRGAMRGAPLPTPPSAHVRHRDKTPRHARRRLGSRGDHSEARAPLRSHDRMSAGTERQAIRRRDAHPIAR